MQSLLEILNKTTDYFEKKGISNARFNSELLIGNILNCKRLDLYLQFERILTEFELVLIKTDIRRRVTREPLQYIIGHVDFFNTKLKIDNRALVPRPETEELIELIIKSLSIEPKKILDVGTGSGAIGIALANYYSCAHITLADIDETTLQLAGENINISGIKNQFEIIQSNWFENIKGKFDLIIANPPYLSENEWSDSEAEVRDYEPKHALVANNNGLSDLCFILEQSPNYLNNNGVIYLETGIYHHSKLIKLANELGAKKIQASKDLSGRDRFICAKFS